MDGYHKIQQIYNKEVEGILDGYIYLEEKVDGSQFRINIKPDGTITCGSKGQEGDLIDKGMFNSGVEKANHVFANYKPEVEMTVFCEYLQSPKHNAINYERVPLNHLMLFDVKRDTLYLNRAQKELFAKQHGLEITPLLWEGEGKEIADKDNPNKINEAFAEEILKRKSILGHVGSYQKIEGFVIKNYNKLYDTNRFRNYEQSTHPWMSAKIVNTEFKEKNREENPNRAQNLQNLKDNYRTEARYMKAIQHKKETGELKFELADLRILIPEVISDIEIEEKENIKDALWKMFGKEITGYASKGMPEFWKKYLSEQKM